MPHRRQGNAQLLGNFLHLQSLARLKAPRQNRLSQHFVNFVSCSFPGDAAQFHS